MDSVPPAAEAAKVDSPALDEACIVEAAVVRRGEVCPGMLSARRAVAGATDGKVLGSPGIDLDGGPALPGRSGLLCRGRRWRSTWANEDGS
jgi:hypothetical protein